MGEDIINLEIITPEETVVKSEILDLYIPAFYGKAGILSNHLPYISLLKSGEISFDDVNKKKHYLYIENGFLEVQGNNISIISDKVVKSEDLNRDEIENRLSEVERKIKSASRDEISVEKLDMLLEENKKLISQKKIVEKLK